MDVPDVLSVLSTPRRREILRALWDAEKSAGEIHRAMPDVSFGAVSQHLKLLEGAGLVRGRADGRFRFYVVQKAALGPLRSWLEAMWDDALYRLKVHAELEAARRGPRAKRINRRERRSPK
ncbi:MAG TPA: metalloregulator ArsR/SmtB family transcription factor [Thermoanaerobaculia bacterium]|jgi:DNA-binding transcriptional ArsR family regulator|nr:metalloregulator ArsR/SmtB family transcription factor [Thermoanaerobaculia bacterium]